jgi:hypothetical protein
MVSVILLRPVLGMSHDWVQVNSTGMEFQNQLFCFVLGCYIIIHVTMTFDEMMVACNDNA